MCNIWFVITLYGCIIIGGLSIITLTVSIGGTGKNMVASKIGGERSLFFCHELGHTSFNIVGFKFKKVSNK